MSVWISPNPCSISKHLYRNINTHILNMVLDRELIVDVEDIEDCSVLETLNGTRPLMEEIIQKRNKIINGRNNTYIS